MKRKVSEPSGKADERGSKRRRRTEKRLSRSPNSGRKGAPLAAPAGRRRG